MNGNETAGPETPEPSTQEPESPEPETPEPESPGNTTPDPEAVNRESHPNASGPQGLTGDLGLSSERADGFEGVEGTGSSASTQGRTDGETPTTRAAVGEPEPDDDQVGEPQPDEVARKHPFDPSRNPGH